MPAHILTQSLSSQRRSLLGWSFGLTALVMVECALWLTMADTIDLDLLLEQYPEPMKELFNLDAMSTPTGFLNAELFLSILPLVFIGYGISRGASTLAGEESQGWLDAVLVTPASTGRVLAEKAAAVVVGLGILGVALGGATLAGSTLFGLGLNPGHVVVGCLAVVLIGSEYALLALAVGAATGRRGVAVVVGWVVAAAAYILDVAAAFVPELEPWRGWSSFHQALDAGPLAAGLPAGALWLPVVGAAAVLAAAPLFARRDLAVH